MRDDAGGAGAHADEWESLVCQPQYTWDCGWALAVIACESSGNAGAVGSEYYNGQYYEFRGLFQVVWGSLDPAENVAQAHHKYVTEGPGAWPNCP